jgi:hypothetical protein
LVLALGIQLQAIKSRFGSLLLVVAGRTIRFVNLKIYVAGLFLVLDVEGVALMVQKLSIAFRHD